LPHDTLPPPGGGDPPNDSLALALAECPRCLGAYLYALHHPGRRVACPGCTSFWEVDPPRALAPVDVEGDLGTLAHWLPTIVGRAVAYGGTGGGSPRHGERPDAIDAHHRSLRHALGVLTCLDALERAGQHRHVRVLWYAYVLCGPELVRTHKGGLADLVAHQFASREQLAFWKQHKSRSVRDYQIAQCGARLLAGATSAYESVVRGTLHGVVRPLEPEGLPATLDELVTRTWARLGNRTAKSGTETPRAGNGTAGDPRLGSATSE
jgi:hypothetical protein